MKTTNLEIYNFLNLTSHRLGRLYKYAGFNPLPDDFEIDKKKIKEKLLLSQMKNEEIFPDFACEEKRKVKKFFKNALKNCKNLQKVNLKSKNFSKEFSEKLEYYLAVRTKITSSILKEFNSHTFDEVAAFREIYNIDPIFGELLKNIFLEKMNLEDFFENLELKYSVSYLEKIQLLEKKQTKKKLKKKETEINLQKEINKKENKENYEKLGKKADKIAKNNEKIKKNQEIKETKQQIKNLQNKKINNKNKEK